jgi:putative Holliday junction resolvase
MTDSRGRILGVDFGGRRIGLAISDASGTIARPLTMLKVGGRSDAVLRVAEAATRLAAEDDGLRAIVVGLPLSLEGAPTDQTAAVSVFVAALRDRLPMPIVTEDERLTSVEAESRLAERETDWRKRKAQIDAEAAAIILQDYLDRPVKTANGES